jgi:hypothetical protein
MRRMADVPAWLAGLAFVSGLYLAASEFLGSWDWFARI